jgi:hypothetical protein
MFIDKKAKGSLIGVNGNAFALLGHFQKCAKKSGWSEEEINQVLKEAKSSDYDHLIDVLMSYLEDEEDEEECDEDDEDDQFEYEDDEE